MASKTYYCGKGKSGKKRQGGPGSESDGECKPPERSPKRAGHDSASSSQYLCPFFIRSPHKHYQCGTHRFQKISHVTQHLQRTHLKGVKFKCPICSADFNTPSDRDAHIREQQCQLRQIDPKDIQADAWEEIQAVTSDKLKGQDQKWDSIYMILFGEPAPQLLPRYSEPTEYLLRHFLQRCSHLNDNRTPVVQPSVDVFGQIISRYLADEPLPRESLLSILRPLLPSLNVPEISAQGYISSIPEGASATSSQLHPAPMSASLESHGSTQFEDLFQGSDTMDTGGSLTDFINFNFETYDPST